MEKLKRYGMAVNLHRCIGCFACQVTCKAEYDIPFGTFRCRVETYRSGIFPNIQKFFLPRICNHCNNAPCIEACEEKALLKNQDGVVLINDELCTGCQLCFEKCPYTAIEVNSYTGKAEKCDFCYSRRVVKGKQPVCVESCMGKALVFGDLNNNKSDISKALKQKNVKVLNPVLGTNPSVFYLTNFETGNSPLGNFEVREQPRTSPAYISHTIEPGAQVSKTVYTSDAMCPSECGITVSVEDGIAKKIYGNPHALINNGAFCAKGASGLQLTYSPHRIKTPLMRTGKRGEDSWKEISWQEALNIIAKKMIAIKKIFGPEAVFFDGGDVTDREAYERLFHAFGTPNIYHHGSICDPNRRWGQGIMMGDERPLPDIQRPILMRDQNKGLSLKRTHDAKLVLNIGANPFVATRFNYMSGGIPAARQENGCTYIVVDPAHTNSAAHADIWTPIRPGTDAALLAAMLHFIIHKDSTAEPSRKYIDHNFLKDYTIGWKDFKDAFLTHSRKRDPSNNLCYFTPEWAEEKTGIPKGNIEKLAHLFGSTKPAAIEIGMHGTAHHTNGDVTSILMTALCLVTGNIDRPGGLVFIDTQKVKKGEHTTGKEFLEKNITREISGKETLGRISELHKDLFGDYPTAWKGVLADLPQKIQKGITIKHGPFRGYSYPVKGLITRAGNPVISAGNTQNWTGALTARDEQGTYLLDLMVFIDTHISVTGKYADIVLPEAGFLERMGLSDVYTMSPEVAIRDQVIRPLHKSRTPFEIMVSLSEALIKNGDTDIKPEDFRKRYNNEEDFINEILSDAPGFYNLGDPLPYPGIQEGALIRGTPDNPSAMIDGVVVKEGEQLTVDWLRKHNGVAVWPASYYRYKRGDGSASGVYPKTNSKKFEFFFSYLENLRKKFRIDLPTTFYWSDPKWNPQNLSYREMKKEYPFQLIRGRVHHAMTMTTVCPYLSETETECMKPLNDNLTYNLPADRIHPEKFSFPEKRTLNLLAGSVSIPVLAFNREDGERLGITTGCVVSLENPLKKFIRGKVVLTEEVMPGVIKTAFGPGGQRASGMGFMNTTSSYTPNINELFDPDNLSPFTGMPGFGDIMVKVIKVKSEK
ncbi:MAG: molybdopterin-dependent oxidoreductase [Nitrospiraceae bacterium]|nr:MAG: molybdopterin-dependent oxidoreductase [Nitrospiraceae bacterium]